MDPGNAREPIKLKTRRRFEGQRHARALNWTCYHNQPFLKGERACRWLVESIEAARVKHGFALWAWCFMPTHVHLLIAPGHPNSASTIGDILRSIKLRVTQRAIAWASRYSARTLERMMHVTSSGATFHRFWQAGGGFDRNVFERSAITEMIDYVHWNPVEAGLCARPADWPWSSDVSYLDRAKGAMKIDWESMRAI